MHSALRVERIQGGVEDGDELRCIELSHNKQPSLISGLGKLTQRKCTLAPALPQASRPIPKTSLTQYHTLVPFGFQPNP